MKKATLNLLFTCLMIFSAMTFADKETDIELVEQVSESVSQDTLVAQLTLTETADSPELAQSNLNKAMDKIRKITDAYAAVQVESDRYTVYQNWDNKKEQYSDWSATQNLRLRSDDTASVLQLTGLLQVQGLVTQQIGFQLSDEKRQQTTDNLVKAALAKVNISLASISKEMGYSRYHIDKVKINKSGQTARPVHRMLASAAMESDAMAVPTAMPGNTQVSLDITVQAEMSD